MGVLLAINSFSQRIVGDWEYSGYKYIIDTNKEDVTDELRKIINENVDIKQNPTIRFLSNGKTISILGGKKEKDTYAIEDDSLTIRNEKFDYFIIGDTLVLSTNHQVVDPYLFKRIKDENPDLKIDRSTIRIYFRRLPGITGIWNLTEIEPITIETNRKEIDKAIINEIRREIPQLELIFMKNGTVVTNKENSSEYFIPDGDTLIIDEQKFKYNIADSVLTLEADLYYFNPTLLDRFNTKYPDLVIGEANIKLSFERLPLDPIVGSWEYNKMESIIKYIDSTEKVYQSIPRPPLILQFSMDGKLAENGREYTSYSTRNGNLSFNNEGFKYKITDNILILSFKVHSPNPQSLGRFINEKLDMEMEEATVNIYFKRLLEYFVYPED